MNTQTLQLNAVIILHYYKTIYLLIVSDPSFLGSQQINLCSGSSECEQGICKQAGTLDFTRKSEEVEP